MEIFSVKNLTFTYPDEASPALRDLSFDVKKGEFLSVIGPSGSGKSTLLRQFKPELCPHGEKSGEILFHGKPLSTVSYRESAEKIGFVTQDPDNRIVTDKVWHELAFGLESLGADTETIRRRTAETAGFFGIEGWFHKDVNELSGGQKQLLNLAAAMVTEPEILILDEPTGQLDPIAASEFISALGRLNRELGTTIIITEHRLEEVFPLCSRVLVIEEGCLSCLGSAKETGSALKAKKSGIFLSMPSPMRIWASVENGSDCPVTVADGRKWLEDFKKSHTLSPVPEKAYPDKSNAAPAVCLEDVWFRYEKNSEDVLRGLSLKACYGEFLCILGGNGVGKSTALSLIAGQNTPYRGKKEVFGRVSALPQDPKLLFSRKSAADELKDGVDGGDISNVISLCRLEKLLNRHPYDLSGGEQQRLALAKALLQSPDILLLDEATKGLDAEFKRTFASIIKSLTASGICVIMVSHDVQFCAENADRCVLFFDGIAVAEDVPRRFFADGSFYATSVSRMARNIIPNAVTAEDVISACGGKETAVPEIAPAYVPQETPKAAASKAAPKPLPIWRKITAAVSGCAALISFSYALKNADLTEVVTKGFSSASGEYKWYYGAFILALFVLALSVSRKSTQSTGIQKKHLTKRTLFSALMVIVAVPITIFIGIYFLGDRKYYFISLLVILETVLPFLLSFERRKPQARELVVIAVLCAIGVAGRAAFIALPGFKPVVALVIIAGVAFGGESGFLVGAVTMFLSNMIFGQGPWTPWQMFTMGAIGFIAGILFRRGILRRSKAALCIFGALITVIIYGGIMNLSSVLMYQPNPNFDMILTAYVTGFPVDIVHAAATAFFLWFLAELMLEKLDRIKTKYGIVDL